MLDNGSTSRPDQNQIPLLVTEYTPNPTYPKEVLALIEKCHQAAYPVVCDGVPPSVADRLKCGYYQVSLHGENLGEWSELGVLGVLSGLQQPFDRGQLVLGIATTTAAIPTTTQPVKQQPESPSLITRLNWKGSS